MKPGNRQVTTSKASGLGEGNRLEIQVIILLKTGDELGSRFKSVTVFLDHAETGVRVLVRQMLQGYAEVEINC